MKPRRIYKLYAAEGFFPDDEDLDGLFHILARGPMEARVLCSRIYPDFNIQDIVLADTRGYLYANWWHDRLGERDDD